MVVEVAVEVAFEVAIEVAIEVLFADEAFVFAFAFGADRVARFDCTGGELARAKGRATALPALVEYAEACARRSRSAIIWLILSTTSVSVIVVGKNDDNLVQETRFRDTVNQFISCFLGENAGTTPGMQRCSKTICFVYEEYLAKGAFDELLSLWSGLADVLADHVFD